MPEPVGTIGLVTSIDSDARADAVTAFHDRYPDVDVAVKDATVQGPDAQQDLVSAISAFDDVRVDVIAVTHGGGADKTLRVFNETPLSPVIAGTDTPTVVGIGHEDDHTLAEDVADQRVMTPTHVGEIAPERAALEDEFADLAARLDAAYDAAIDRTLTSYATALYTRTERQSRRSYRTSKPALTTLHSGVSTRNSPTSRHVWRRPTPCSKST